MAFSKKFKQTYKSMSNTDLAAVTHHQAHAWLADSDHDLAALMRSSDVKTVAVAGDWHGESLAAALAFHQALRVGADVLVQLGDLGVWPGRAGLRYLHALSFFVEETGIPLLFVDGNHEDFTQLEAAPKHSTGLGVLQPGVLHLARGMTWQWGGKLFAALGGAPSIDRLCRVPGESWWPQEVVTDADVALLEGNLAGRTVDVMFTHDTAVAAPLPVNPAPLPPIIQMEADEGRKQLTRAVEIARPHVLMHGHYHTPLDYQLGATHVASLNMNLQKGMFAVLHL